MIFNETLNFFFCEGSKKNMSDVSGNFLNAISLDTENDCQEGVIIFDNWFATWK